MKFGVVIFPGSNCDQDMIHVLRNVINAEVVELWHKQDNLDDFTTDDCIVLPGGFGTLDELFEALTLVQTQKTAKFPIILVGTDYWKGLLDWIKNTMLDEEKNISADDLNLFKLVDTADEAVNEILEFYSKYSMSLNF